jgi:hypothetical protein
MNTEMKLHLAKYMKYMDQKKNVLVVIGNLEEILVSQQLYEEHHHIPSDNGDTLNRLLNACALSATSLSDKESWGWTLTLPGSDQGYFVGMEPEGMICARKKAAAPEMAKAYLQRQTRNGPLMQSHFEPATNCPVQTIAQYFNEVVQTETRVMVRDNTGILVQALPDAQFSAVKALSEDQLFDMYMEMQQKEELKPMEEYLVFYECRCDEEMIYKMVENLPQHQKDTLFEDLPVVEIECPRCGRQYTASRNNLPN